MNVKINITQLKYMLDNIPADQNIMLGGRHGIGKSEILTEYFSKAGMPVIALFLGQMSDPGDLIGLPNKDEKTGKTEFMPPYWFPIDNKPIVLFLDELNHNSAIDLRNRYPERLQLSSVFAGGLRYFPFIIQSHDTLSA